MLLFPKLHSVLYHSGVMALLLYPWAHFTVQFYYRIYSGIAGILYFLNYNLKIFSWTI